MKPPKQLMKAYSVHFIWAAIAAAAFFIGRPGDSISKSNQLSEDDSEENARKVVKEMSDSSSSEENQEVAGNGGASTGKAGVKELLALILNDPDPSTQAMAYAKLLEAVTAENGADIFRALREGGGSREQMQLFLFTWGKVGGKAALEAARSGTDTKDLAYDHGQLLAGWASEDLSAAMSYLIAAEKSEEEHFKMTKGLVNGLIAFDIDLATKYLTELSHGGFGKEAIGYLNIAARQQVQRLGVDRALAWGDDLPDGELKASALNTVIKNYAKEDALAASEFAEKFASNDWAAAIVSRVAEDWAEEDSLASVTWLESLPQGAGRSKASYTAFREWVRRDSNAASVYISEMEASPARDHAAWALSDTISRHDPEAAVKWANEIVDPQLHRRVVRPAVQYWLQSDRDAALEWIEGSGWAPAQYLR